jgi:hypothetical protein
MKSSRSVIVLVSALMFLGSACGCPPEGWKNYSSNLMDGSKRLVEYTLTVCLILEGFIISDYQCLKHRWTVTCKVKQFSRDINSLKFVTYKFCWTFLEVTLKNTSFLGQTPFLVNCSFITVTSLSGGVRSVLSLSWTDTNCSSEMWCTG